MAPPALESATPLARLAEQAAARFAERYDRRPTVVAAAPGRVNLIGEHTDYNDGFVLPMAIERYTVVAAGAADHGEVCLRSTSLASEAHLTLAGDPAGEAAAPDWAKYAAGVLRVGAEDSLRFPAIDAIVDSTVPLGGGLSSSAALEVGLLTALAAIGDVELAPKRVALLAQRAEHHAGTPCGIMDQFSSAMCEAGHAMLLDCRDQSAEMLPLGDASLAVLITNTNVKHELTGGEYAERRRQCEEAARSLGVASLREATLDRLAPTLSGVHLRRARHVVGEIDRTTRAARALAENRWEEFGRLMDASHDSLRDDYEVSCRELDAVVDATRQIGPDRGLLGSRMTGGGFGGCVVSLVRREAAETIAAEVAAAYSAETGLEATQFLTRPARGAHLVSRA